MGRVKQLVLRLLSLKGCVARELSIVSSGGSTTLNWPLLLPGAYWRFSQASSSSPVHPKGIQFVHFEKILCWGAGWIKTCKDNWEISFKAVPRSQLTELKDWLRNPQKRRCVQAGMYLLKTHRNKKVHIRSVNSCPVMAHSMGLSGLCSTLGPFEKYSLFLPQG